MASASEKFSKVPNEEEKVKKKEEEKVKTPGAKVEVFDDSDNEVEAVITELQRRSKYRIFK